MLLTTSILKARMDISEIIMHEDYNSNTVDQDFALLKMARKVRLSWKRQKSLFSRNSWTGPRTRTSDRHACQALVLVTMTSGCPQSQVLFLFSLLVILFRMVLLTMIMIIMTIKKILRLGNDLVWWLHQQCAPRGRRQGKVSIFKSQFINYFNTTKSCSKRRYSQNYPKFCIGFKIRKSRCKQLLLSGSGHSKWFSSAALQGVMWDWVEQ